MSLNPAPSIRSQFAAAEYGVRGPGPDNVEALADAVNRFHGHLSLDLSEALIEDVTRAFAAHTLERATVVVHFTKDGER